MSVDLILLVLAPVFFMFIGWEICYWRRQRRAVYAWRDTLCNAALALMYQLSDKLAWLLAVPVYAFFYQHRLLTMPSGGLGGVVLFLAQDFCYYWFHRASHRCRWLWASHVVHHSSERLNFSTAFRQSVMYPVSGMWLFWIPVAWLGFPPTQVVAVVLLNLAAQFFIHTQAVPKLGWLEHVLNTPSIHRVHHARNPEYIDCNYAGVLVIWDRLFGSYVEENQPCEYGIVKAVHSHNPLVLTFHEWGALWRDCWRAPTWRLKGVALFAAPERAERVSGDPP